MNRTRPTPIALLLAAIIVAACGGAPATSAPPPAPTGLPAGTYKTVAFVPQVTYTLPDGWEIASDTPGYLLLRPAGSEVAGIHLFRDVRAAIQDAECSGAEAPGIGATSAALSIWTRERPGLVVSDPALVSIGGLDGVQLDIGIRADWTASCPFAEGLPTVPFVTGPSGYHWVIAGAERLRVTFLDLPGGGTILVDIDDFSGEVIGALLVDATPIVASMSFATD